MDLARSINWNLLSITLYCLNVKQKYFLGVAKARGKLGAKGAAIDGSDAKRSIDP